MTASNKSRTVLALLLTAAGAMMVLSQPLLVRQALEGAIALWWDHLVPILLPGYVLAQAIQALAPRRLGWWLILLSLATFPALTAIVLYDNITRSGQDRRHGLPLLLYTNLYNPLLLPHPLWTLRLDGALLAAALILAPPWRMPIVTLPPVPLRPRQWILDGMNWTTILGMVVSLAWLGHAFWPAWGLGWLIDPILIHWGAHPPASLPTVFFTALGGLVWWIPIAGHWDRNARSGWTLLAARVIQAALASGLFFAIGL
ncbi:hypothetical protein [Sulfobacillus harzensis]|uniref:Uncharacterized protein n=1 Tax=Sulfobacillus harzensis TaxID=2729629 RepID=A0A7Y0L6T9_9FIRM|nr:hypothetical protein [Sulfobacillus harzensis]NMP22989.1 hypothetical protein [Sulfobacillus harzensis]